MAKSQKKSFIKFVFVFFIILVGGFFSINIAFATESCGAIQCDASNEKYFNCNQGKQDCLKNKIAETQSSASTLKNTIAILNGQISLQQLQINQTLVEIETLEEEVDELTERIGGLSLSLDRLSAILIERIRANYKQSRIPLQLSLINSRSFNELITQFKYLSLAQKQTATAMQRTESQRQLYDEQKQLKEEKQTEVEKKQIQLQQERNNFLGQKQEKQYFLETTKNDEKKFQIMLESVRAELEAIEAIISRKGAEVRVGKISKGERIASIIQGKSCNSDGSHVQFTVINADGKTVNPFNYLKKIDHKNCSGPGSCSPGDTFNPTGNWDWPINPTITFTQGYGATWAIKNTWVGKYYKFHDGLDINNSNSPTVKTVANGVLYRGSYTGKNGCRLKYVRVDHDENNLSTLYLHINY